MEIGGFQVQPTLRPEDVVVAGIEPAWLVVLVVVVNEVEMIRKSKFVAILICVQYSYLHSFLYSNTTHICIYIKEMKDIGDTLQTRPPKRARTNLWTTTVLGNTWKYST